MLPRSWGGLRDCTVTGWFDWDLTRGVSLVIISPKKQGLCQAAQSVLRRVSGGMRDQAGSGPLLEDL